MLILGIDPGTRESGAVLLDTARNLPVWKQAGLDNDATISLIRHQIPDDSSVLACEMVGHYGTGMSVGREVYETVVWIGRFQEAWESRGRRFQLILRKEVTAHLCRSVTAKDANVRQALIDLWGGETLAIGGKKCPTCKGATKIGRGKARESCLACYETPGWLYPPGPLHGISAHAWQALGVAVTCRDLCLSPTARGTTSPNPTLHTEASLLRESDLPSGSALLSEPGLVVPLTVAESPRNLHGSRGDE